MNHYASPEFWQSYRLLPVPVQRLADRCYGLLKRDARHPSLQLKKVGRYYAARVGLHHRAVGIESKDGIVWFWIGHHSEYDKLIR